MIRLEEMIHVHQQDKTQLLASLLNRVDALDPCLVAKDDICELGKWLNGEGLQYTSFKVYEELKAAHARFHIEASKLVQRANRGEAITNELKLSSDTEFSKYSALIVLHLRELMIIKRRTIASSESSHENS